MGITEGKTTKKETPRGEERLLRKGAGMGVEAGGRGHKIRDAGCGEEAAVTYLVHGCSIFQALCLLPGAPQPGEEAARENAKPCPRTSSAKRGSLALPSSLLLCPQRGRALLLLF